MNNEKLAEGDGLADVGGVYNTISIYRMTIAEGALHAPEKHMPLHRTPATLALDNALGADPSRIWTHQHQVGLIALTDKTTMADFEETGRIVTHQLHKTF